MARSGSIAVWLFACAVAATFPLNVAGQRPAAAPGGHLSNEQIEAFLLNADVESRRATGAGVTDSTRATLTDGALTHEAQIQTVDIAMQMFAAGNASEVNFKDSYRYNIAAYRLSTLLGMDNVPVSVERRFNGKPAAFTWWLDDVQMTEKERLARKTLGPNPTRTSEQLQVMRVFDELIQNKDRNQGNIVWTADWTMWLIDHTRAFRTGEELLKTDDLKRCDRSLLTHLRALTAESVEQAMDGMLTGLERGALLARRDRLVEHYDARIKNSGEAAVLFDLH